MPTITAFVLILVKSGEEDNVLEEIWKMKEVKEARIVYGPWDLICRIEVEHINQLQTFIYELRKIPGVEQTTTLIST